MHMRSKLTKPSKEKANTIKSPVWMTSTIGYYLREESRGNRMIVCLVSMSRGSKDSYERFYLSTRQTTKRAIGYWSVTISRTISFISHRTIPTG